MGCWWPHIQKDEISQSVWLILMYILSVLFLPGSAEADVG